MPNFVAVTVYNLNGNGASGYSVGFPATGAGGIRFEPINQNGNALVLGSTYLYGKIKAPATGLNQKATDYYTVQTVAQLITLFG